MNVLTNTTGDGPVTMSSREIAELVNSRHDKVKQSIERLAERGVIQLPPLGDVKNHLGQTVQEYRVGKRDSYVIVAQLSPEFTARLVDRWQELETAAPQIAIPTTAEAFASAFQMIAASERTQKEQQKAISRLEEKVQQVEAAQVVMRSRPANAEGITHIRARIGKVFGLSSAIIDEVMRQSPYAPRPAGTVRNDHIDADGSSYTVYWQKDVTAVFSRFVDECHQVTPVLFTHPFVEGRFRVGVSKDPKVVQALKAHFSGRAA